jgi:imidazolonepropionase-like amidohydrolase
LLASATWNAADLIGDTADIGSVQPGRYADIVATPGNPLSEPAQFGHVSFVMKAGVVYRKDSAPVAPCRSGSGC